MKTTNNEIKPNKTDKLIIDSFKECLKLGDTEYLRIFGNYLSARGFSRTSIDKIDDTDE